MAVQPMMPMDVEGTAETIAANRKRIKHIGFLKSDNSSVAILFRTVPNEPNNCLVIGPKFLDNNYHDSFIKSLESPEGQSSFELGKFIARQRFTDGVEMLSYLHQNNFIKKMPTKDIAVTFGTGNNGTISLDKLNTEIAKQKNISLLELSLLDAPVVEEKIKTDVTKSAKKTKK